MGMALMVAGAVVVLAVGGYFLRGGRRPEKPVVHHARCPRCEQKVRYAADRAGQRVMCPRCGRNWVLPTTPQPLSPASARADGRRLLRSA